MPALPEATDAIIRTTPRGHLVIAKGYLPLTTNVTHWLRIRKNHPNPALRTLEIDFCDRPSLFCQSCPITPCRQVELIVALRPLPLPRFARHRSSSSARSATRPLRSPGPRCPASLATG